MISYRATGIWCLVIGRALGGSVSTARGSADAFTRAKAFTRKYLRFNFRDARKSHKRGGLGGGVGDEEDLLRTV